MLFLSIITRAIIRRSATAMPVTLICAGLLLSAPSTQAGEIQSLASIQLQAEAFITGYPYTSPYPPRFKLARLDNRLRLKPCREALSIEFSRREQVWGNTALLVRCPVKSGWKIHLPVTVEVFDDVLVAARPLVKGQKIDETRVTYEKHNIARLKNGYYSRDSVLGLLEAKRNLSRGSVLTPANLKPLMLVRSGQQVTLLLDYNGLQVRSSGKALRSARLGELVKVRNSQSNKIVEGVVAGEGVVRISI